MAGNKGGFLSVHDKDGSLAALVDSHREEYQAEHPDLNITASDTIRLLLREGSNSIRSKAPPKLQDKQNRGKLRKG